MRFRRIEELRCADTQASSTTSVATTPPSWPCSSSTPRARLHSCRPAALRGRFGDLLTLVRDDADLGTRSCRSGGTRSRSCGRISTCPATKWISSRRRAVRTRWDRRKPDPRGTATSREDAASRRVRRGRSRRSGTPRGARYPSPDNAAEPQNRPSVERPGSPNLRF